MAPPRRTLLAIGLCVLLAGGGSSIAADATFEGTLIGVHTDDFAHGRATFKYSLETAQGTYELKFANGVREVLLGRKVSVRGVRSGNTLAVAGGGVKASGDTTAVASATGAKRVAVILFTFSDNSTQPYTPAYAEGVAFTNADSVAAYYAESSWGKLTLSGDVFGWYSIPAKSTGCGWSTWAADADAAAKAAGVDLNAYDNRVYAFPSVNGCGWAGLSYMPGTQSWLNGTSGMSLHVMAHELGHNFGTDHANSYACTESGVRVSLAANPASCTSTEYGDPWSVMGSLTSRRQLTDFSRGNFGWLTTNALDVSQSGTYLLEPIEPYDSTGVQALRVKRDASTYFLLEFRQPYGHFDNFLPIDLAVNGVMVRIVRAYSTLSQSQLVDATPSTSGYVDAALALGRSLFDPLSKVTFTTTAISSGRASVQILFGQDSSAPTTPTNLSATEVESSRIALSWSPSTDDAGVAGYKIYRDGSYLATAGSTSYADSGLPAGATHSYYVTAVDAANNESTPSNTVTATTSTSDMTPPSAPTNLTATQAEKGSGSRIVLSWGASTDDVGVAGYRLYLNGSLMTTVSGATLTFTTKARRGVSTYYVVAFDAAGNASGPSNSASVTA